MKRIGVLLSGCGVYDGVEIHEAVITLLSIDQMGASYLCLAPDIDHYHVVNHLTGESTGETRNVLVEAARIARGEIHDIKKVTASDIDGLIMPGGFGAAKNLSNYAIKGKDADVNPEVARLMCDLHNHGKPIGAMCIAPTVLTKVLHHYNPEVTIGNELGAAEAIEAMGGIHKVCVVNNIHIDYKNKLVTTPAYMLGPRIRDIAIGIKKLVEQILNLCYSGNKS